MSLSSKESSKPPRRKRRWLRRVLFLSVGFIIFSLVSVEVTSRSSFCNTCHIMKSYYTSWESGTHKEVSCVECHIDPGATNYAMAKLNGLGQVVDDLLNRTSFKPSTSVTDFACTRDGCHIVAELDPEKDEWRPYLFDHAIHLEKEYAGIEIHCATCHSHIEGSEHFGINTNACITCHLLEGDTPSSPPETNGEPAPDLNGFTRRLIVRSPRKSIINEASHISLSEPEEVLPPSRCQDCHAPPDAPFSYRGLTIDHSEFLRFGAACESCHRGTTKQPDSIEDGQCFNCHDYGVERFTDTEDMHRVHLQGEHKVECFNCHGITAHGPLAEAMTLDRFACQDCHQDQHLIQRTAYGTNGIKPHDANGDAVTPMFLVHVDCTGCHIHSRTLKAKPTSGAHVTEAVAEACDNCHQKGFGAKMIPLWQNSTHELFDQVTHLLPVKDGDWPRGNDEAEQLVKRARGLLNTVEVDGSWGVHNPRYTQQLLERAREYLLNARTLCGVILEEGL